MTPDFYFEITILNHAGLPRLSWIYSAFLSGALFIIEILK
jgi:hypothetical protein